MIIKHFNLFDKYCVFYLTNCDLKKTDQHNDSISQWNPNNNFRQTKQFPSLRSQNSVYSTENQTIAPDNERRGILLYIFSIRRNGFSVILSSMQTEDKSLCKSVNGKCRREFKEIMVLFCVIRASISWHVFLFGTYNGNASSIFTIATD